MVVAQCLVVCLGLRPDNCIALKRFSAVVPDTVAALTYRDGSLSFRLCTQMMFKVMRNANTEFKVTGLLIAYVGSPTTILTGSPLSVIQSLRARTVSAHVVLLFTAYMWLLWSTVSKPFQNESISGFKI